MVNVTVDGRSIEMPEDSTILEATRLADARVPTLCYLRDVSEVGACRICLVEAEGCQQLLAACSTRVWDGAVVFTDTPRLRLARREVLKLILSQHEASCTTCARNGSCELQALACEFGIVASVSAKAATPSAPNVGVQAAASEDPVLVRDVAKCIQCMRCVNVCGRIQQMGVWQLGELDGRTSVMTAGAGSLDSSSCTLCGQCVNKCPTGALHERDDCARVLRALADPNTTVLAQMAPAVRVAWGEAAGIPRDAATAGHLVAALKKVGFDYVLDTALAADLTIMEEGSELIEKLEQGDTDDLPLFTSCCAAWQRFVETEYPGLAPRLSTAKSPQQMLGALIRTYFAQKLDIDPAKTLSVAVMPCTAKKAEARMHGDELGRPDVDVVLTTRELLRLLGGVNLEDLEPQTFDSPLGAESGSGVIFGRSAGVMESALRTVTYLLTGEKPQPNFFLCNMHERACWKEGVFKLGTRSIKVAVAHGLGNARKLVEAILAKEVRYDFVEVMACPGGCAGGGGQPVILGSTNENPVEQRDLKLRDLDIANELRFSNESPFVIQCYEEFLGEPLSPLAHKLLHVERGVYE